MCRTCAPELPSISQGKTLHKTALAPWGRQGAWAPLGVPTPAGQATGSSVWGRGRVEQETAEKGAGAPVRGERDGSSTSRRVTRARGRGAPASDPREQGVAGRLTQNSPPLSLPQERGTGTRCATPENSWGTSPAPHPLPSFPARCPAWSGPYLPALRLPGRPARCGRLGGWAGGPAGSGRRATRPRTWRTRLGRHSLRGGQGRKERQPRAPGRGGWKSE